MTGLATCPAPAASVVGKGGGGGTGWQGVNIRCVMGARGWIIKDGAAVKYMIV